MSLEFDVTEEGAVQVRTKHSCGYPLLMDSSRPYSLYGIDDALGFIDNRDGSISYGNQITKCPNVDDFYTPLISYGNVRRY